MTVSLCILCILHLFPPLFLSYCNSISFMLPTSWCIALFYIVTFAYFTWGQNGGSVFSACDHGFFFLSNSSYFSLLLFVLQNGIKAYTLIKSIIQLTIYWKQKQLVSHRVCYAIGITVFIISVVQFHKHLACTGLRFGTILSVQWGCINHCTAV